jgi:ribosomal protein L11 methyltransferase
VIRLAVRVQREHAELVLAELLELAPAGVEERPIGEHAVEYAVYGAPGELPGLPDLKAAAGDALVEITTSETADDWQERWKQFHHPVLIEPFAGVPAVGRRVPALHVRPPWASASVARGNGTLAQELVIDPGQAFGTGSHATTRLCLRLLLELAGSERELGALLDVGTGSGVLAIAGALLGFAPVLALDHDRLSVDAARANAAVNAADVELRRLDLRSEPLPWLAAGDTPASPLVVTANLLRPLLLDLAAATIHPPAHVVASGLLVEQVDEIVTAFAERTGMCEHKRLSSGEWAAVWLVAS